MTKPNLTVGTEYGLRFPNGTPARVRLVRMLPPQASIRTDRNAFPGVDDMMARCEVEIITPQMHGGETRDVNAVELQEIEEVK